MSTHARGPAASAARRGSARRARRRRAARPPAARRRAAAARAAAPRPRAGAARARPPTRRGSAAERTGTGTSTRRHVLRRAYCTSTIPTPTPDGGESIAAVESTYLNIPKFIYSGIEPDHELWFDKNH